MAEILYESKVKNALYFSKYNRIIQFAPIRTGSTVLWQMLDYLFEDRTYTKNKWKHPNYVVKAHKLHKKYVKEGNVYFITIRNPLEAIASTIRVRFFEQPLSETFEMITQLMIGMFEQVYKIRNDPNVFVFRYENFHNNYGVFLDKIEEIFEIKINDEHKAEMLKKFSREGNLKISKEFDSFQELDPHTLVHGDHVAEKEYSWREIIQDENRQQYLITQLKPIMEKFSYSVPD